MNKVIAPYWLLVLALLLAGCELPRPDEGEAFTPPTAAVAQTEAVIRLEPATSQLNVGETRAVEVRIDNVTNLVGAEIQLQFNPAILQVQDADPNKDGAQIQPGDFPAPDFVGTNIVTGTGLINYAVTQLPPRQPVSGSGLFATITFQAIAPGSSDLVFAQAILVSSPFQSVPVTPQGGQITVGQVGGSPTATFTVTSTPIPGQPTATPTFTPLPGTPIITPIVTPTLPATPVLVTATPTPTFTPTPVPTPTATNTPAPPAVEIPPGATLGFCYRVQPGETLLSLADKFGLEPRFLNRVNDLYPPGHVFAQQVLFIPEQSGRGPNVYRVQPGDSLAAIAETCRLAVDFLAAVNGLTPATNLANIEFLIIPRPPFAPPARYGYPQVGPPSVWPPPCCKPH